MRGGGHPSPGWVTPGQDRMGYSPPPPVPQQDKSRTGYAVVGEPLVAVSDWRTFLFVLL